MVVDLAGVAFGGSTLAGIHRAGPTGSTLLIWRATPMVRTVLRVTNMAEIATIRDDASALISFPSPLRRRPGAVQLGVEVTSYTAAMVSRVAAGLFNCVLISSARTCRCVDHQSRTRRARGASG